MSAPICLAIFVEDLDRLNLLKKFLDSEEYLLQFFTTKDDFLGYIINAKKEIDCLILSANHKLLPVVNYLYERGIVLPAVIIEDNNTYPVEISNINTYLTENWTGLPIYIYHPSEVHCEIGELTNLKTTIEQAIAQFLNLAPIYRQSNSYHNDQVSKDLGDPHFLLQQQRRLAEKLKERLGYLAVYYKRNPQFFIRHLSPEESRELVHNLKKQYREIILAYFISDESVNEAIDEFVSLIFFADLSVSQIVEIHMELMEEFSKQLQLEGRSEEILLDYRLTLIDIIAHLCEMYRRSIPREI